MRTFPLLAAGVMMASVLVVATPAEAIPLSYKMVGTLTSVQDDPVGELSGHFSVGDAFSSDITIDTTVGDINAADPEFGRYPAVSFVTTIGAHSWSGNAEHRVFDRAGSDGYSIVNETGFSGWSAGVLVPETFFVQFFDTTGALYISDALVAVPPDLSDFDLQINGLRLGDPADNSNFGVLRFEVNSVATSVPTPATAALVIPMLAWTTYARRRRA